MSEYLEMVKNIVFEVIPGLEKDEITSDKDLRELGANSVDRMGIITMILEKTERRVSPMELAKLKTVGELVHFFES